MKKIKRGTLILGGIAAAVAPSVLISCGTEAKSSMNKYSWAELKNYFKKNDIKGFGTLTTDQKSDDPYVMNGEKTIISLERAGWGTHVDNVNFYIFKVNGEARTELANYLKSNDLTNFYNKWFEWWKDKYFPKGMAKEYYDVLEKKTVYDMLEIDGVVIYVEKVKEFFENKGLI